MNAPAELKAGTAARTLPDARLLIGGRWVEGERLAQTLDKFRLQPCTTLHLPSRAQVAEAVASAHSAWRASRLTPHERGAILERAATLLEQRSDELVRALQIEVGFPASDGLNELRRCVNTFRLSAEEARNFRGEMVPIEGAAGQAGRLGFTLRVPLGVVVRDHALQCAAQYRGAQGRAGAAPQATRWCSNRRPTRPPLPVSWPRCCSLPACRRA